MPRRRFTPITILSILFLSGAAGLGYQIAWTRLFTAGLGHEIPSVLAVVTAFFAGSALGAWWLDRPIGRSRRPARWYALLELMIGVWALCSVELIPVANGVVSRWIGPDPSPVRQWILTFIVPLCVLLPATMAMGASLPAVERWLAPRTGDGRCLGAVHAANTLGAFVGILAGAFVLLPSLGYRRSILLFGLVNLVCALAAAVLDWRLREHPDGREGARSAGVPVAGVGRILFFSGLLGIGYEVLGVRALSQVLEGTVYTFAATLAVFLLGTAAGAALYQRCLRHLPYDPVKNGLLAALSAVVAAGVFVVVRSHDLYQAVRGWWGDTPVAVSSAEMLVSAAVFALPAIVMGAIFSHLTQHSRGPLGGVGRGVALNTLGASLAPALFGAVLLPALGLKWAFVLLTAGYVALTAGSRRFLMIGAAVLAFMIIGLPSPIQFLEVPPGVTVVSHRDGVMDSVTVVEFPDRNLSLLVNARFGMGGTGSVVAERRHAQIPLLLHPDPRRAMFLGLGTGITFAAASTHPELAADGVELVPEVVEAMPLFAPFNDLASVGRRLKVHTADARRFVRATGDPYDVIVADLFHPARDGAGALYTREHFQAIRSRLAPGGVFCQWLPLHQLDETMLKVIIRTFLEVFPETDAWLLRFNVDTPVLGLVGRSEVRKFPVNWMETRVRNPELREQLKSLALTDELQLFGLWLAGPETLRAFTQGSTINTDDRPVVVFGAPRFYYRRDSRPHGRLSGLLDLPVPDAGRLVTGPDPERLDQFGRRLSGFISARNVYLRGLIVEAEGNLPGAIDAYVESARLSADFSTGYARCLTLAMQQSGSNLPGARGLLERLVRARPERPVAAELLERLKQP